MTKKNPCGDLFILTGNPTYNNTVFNRFFEQNDASVLGWSENVLAKLTAEGILPTFLQKKDNEDFKAYWGTITHLFALIVIYARKYKEIDSNKILFETFIQNKGLLTDLVNSQEQMEYLFYNYLKEYSKRGCLNIVSKEGAILGELLRLIRYDNLDEFIFTLLQPQNTGWVIGHSSPTWRGTSTIENITKAYEFTSDIIDLNKYPLLRSVNISLTKDRDSNNELINVMTFSGNQPVGIQSSPTDLSKYILIDPNISYEISLRVKVADLQNQNLKFGVKGFNSKYNPVNFLVLQGYSYRSNSNWFHSSSFLNLAHNEIYYELKGIILAERQVYKDAPALNFPSGRALSFNPNMNFITPVFIQERSSNSDPLVYLYDFKVKPLTLPFEQGYLGARDIIASYYKNNAFQKETSINTFLETYLLSYKNIFGSKQIVRNTDIHRIIFKVFSDRNKCIQNAVISIAGSNLKTNINGEVSTRLWPGEYPFSVSANEFDSIRNQVLIIEQSSTGESINIVKYIQLKGVVYQSAIVFSIKENGNPLSGVKVTFNNQTQITKENGLAFFEVFLGTYSYRIEKEGYYTINRNINIEGGTTIDIDLQVIPYYNVSFRVRDGISPVSGAAVIITGDFDGSGKVSEQTGSTNSLGVASGFTMRAGTYRYKISREGFLPIENDFNIIGNATIEIPVSPVPKRNITFIVKSNEIPLSGVNINFNGVTQTTGSSGRLIFNEPDGDYYYTIIKKDFIIQTGTLTISGVDIIKNINLVQASYPVKFIVKDDKGAFLPGVNVVIGTESLVTNPSGEVSFVRPRGNYNWTATLQDYYQESGVVAVTESSVTVGVSLTLITYNAIFTIRINGIPQANQPVICNNITLNTDSQGITRFNLKPGSYEWSVVKKDYDTQTGTVVLTDKDTSINVDLIAAKGTVILTAKDSVLGTPLSNATITINGESKQTDASGHTSFLLVLGNYNYRASIPGYNTNEGTLQVILGSSSKEILMVKDSEKTYSLVFTAKEGATLLSGVNISLSNGLTGVTNSQGQSIFTVVPGIYNYTSIYNAFFDTLQSTVTVAAENTTVALNFIRKITDVSFKVKDSISLAAVSGVSIDFNSQIKTTNTSGDAIFTGIPMSSTSLKYIASKNPPYKDSIGFTTVNIENPAVEIKMGLDTYDVIFTARTNTGAAIANSIVSCNGKTGTTNASGQAILQGFIEGSYPYTITNNAYQTQTGTATVVSSNTYVNVVMIPIFNTITIHVQFDANTPAPGVSVGVGSNIITTSTNGDAVFSLKDGGYSYVVGEGDNYFPISGNFNVTSSNQTIVAILEDVFTLELTTAQNLNFSLPILNTSSDGLSQLKVDWGDGSVITVGKKSHLYTTAGTGRKLKISMGAHGGILKWCFGYFYEIATSPEEKALIEKNAESVIKILQWFQAVSKINFLNGSFKRCRNLVSLGLIKGSQCYGTPREIFYNCKSLTAIPDGFFNWEINSGDFYAAFYSSGLTGSVSQGLFLGVDKMTEFSSAFSNTAITSVDFMIPENLSVNCAAMFHSCSNLVRCLAFSKATQITNLTIAFANCLNLSEWPVINKITTPVNISQLFYNCKSLPSNNIPNYLPRNATICEGCFQYCVNIGYFHTGLFGSKVTNLKNAFFNCIKLADISNTKVPIDVDTYHVTNYEGTYMNSSVLSIPSEFFKGMNTVSSFKNTFKNCRSLENVNANVGTGIFADCSPTTMEGCFEGCGKLNSSITAIFGWSGTPTINTKSVARSCVNYKGCFRGCAELTFEAPNETPNTQILYIYEWANQPVIAGGVTLFELPSADGSECFKNCTKMLYYNNIPVNWK